MPVNENKAPQEDPTVQRSVVVTLAALAALVGANVAEAEISPLVEAVGAAVAAGGALVAAVRAVYVKLGPSRFKL